MDRPLLLSGRGENKGRASLTGDQLPSVIIAANSILTQGICNPNSIRITVPKSISEAYVDQAIRHVALLDLVRTCRDLLRCSRIAMPATTHIAAT